MTPTTILLDIEGTTTPIAFVHDTLFAYSRLHLDAWLAEHAGSRPFDEVEAAFASEHASDPDGRKALFAWRHDTLEDQRESIATYAWFLMDRGSKSTALKTLQGLIWEVGFRTGELRGVVYDDVPRALERWRAADIAVAIYSSGSELAQKRLFGSVAQGGLLHLIAHHFDTRVGAKGDPQSYRQIAQSLGTQPNAVLFVSDVTSELAAAREAGLATRLSLRPGNPPQPDAEQFEGIASFDDLFPDRAGTKA